jgi:sugar diacid utilization regulator
MTKASELSIGDLTSFFRGSGEEVLKNNGMMLTSTGAWGVLRKDLITTLGVERAKRFLLRYGWHCGKNEARILKQMFDWKDDLEWLVAGSRMHHIGGRVFSYPIKFDVDIEKGHFDVAGYWIDSYEAKQHLQHFSQSHEPICFFLMGYAGGYTSECLGKKILFKETHCIAKGDKHCRYTGKTIELWGDEISNELINYEEQDIADELDIVYRRVEHQKEILKIGSSISKKLTNALLQGKGLEEFSEILSKEVRFPVFIQNQYFDCISYYYDEEVHGDLVEYYNFYQTQFQEAIVSSRRTMQIELGERKWGLTTPIIIRQEVCGYISLYKEGLKFDESEIDFLERSATICALQMLNERTVIQTEERMKGELLEQLFEKNTDASPILKKLSYLGYNLNQPHYVMIVEFDENGISPELMMPDDDRFTKLKNYVLQYLDREETHYNCRFIKLEKINKLIILVPHQFIHYQKSDMKKFGKQCQSILAKEKEGRNVSIYIGISQVCENVNDFYKKFREAKKAIEFSKVKMHVSKESKNHILTSAEDLGPILMLLDARKPDELLDYAHQSLGIIKSYDEKNASELLLTLFYYIENECNLHKTSRLLNVSISGMRYRMQRIQELTDLDLSKSSTRFELQLALQIYVVYEILKLT